MKTKKRVIVICLLALSILLLGCTEEPETPKAQEKVSLGILEMADRSSVEAYLKDNQLSEERDYIMTTEVCSLYAQDLLGSKADIEITFEGERILWIDARFELFFHEFAEEEITDDGVPQYGFTQADKEQIEKAFGGIRGQMERYLGCQLSEYELVPIVNTDGQSNSDPEQAFYQGLVLREYSVRDANGVLWLLRYDAFDGRASAALHRIVDESGYESFIPIVDMTK